MGDLSHEEVAIGSARFSILHNMLNIELSPIVFKAMQTYNIPTASTTAGRIWSIIKVEQELAQKHVILKMPYLYEKEDYMEAIEAGNVISYNGSPYYFSDYRFLASKFARNSSML